MCDEHGNKLCRTGWKLPDCKTCSQHWFGRHCATPCVPRDHPTRGHYTCDEKDGSKKCLLWWHGERCDTHCVPHDDPVLGHYNCAKDGAKSCMENWHGVNCTTYCAPQNNSINGHYRCDQDGKKVCLDGYSPPDCRECVPGRYGPGCAESCLHSAGQSRTDNVVCSEDGELECRPWWHGVDCDVYCVPHDDSEHGHYQCGANGEVECLEGWASPSCRAREGN